MIPAVVPMRRAQKKGFWIRIEKSSTTLFERKTAEVFALGPDTKSSLHRSTTSLCDNEAIEQGGRMRRPLSSNAKETRCHYCAIKRFQSPSSLTKVYNGNRRFPIAVDTAEHGAKSSVEDPGSFEGNGQPHCGWRSGRAPGLS